VFQLAGALERGSTHPFAHALRQAWLQQTEETSPEERDSGGDALSALRGLGFAAIGLEHSAGHGVAAVLGDEAMPQSALYLGSANWCGLSDSDRIQWQEHDDATVSAASEVYLVRRVLPGQERARPTGSPLVMARFLISDTLRPEACALIAQLQARGLTVHLLSGDRSAAVQAVARQLQIDRFSADVKPADKQAYVTRLQHAGKTVLMVGDGINDAPVLASADVSLAAGEATALARTAADVISLLPGLSGLESLLAKSAQTMKIVRQNLTWAALYNFTAIPLAALGYVPPWAAAIGMAGSSLLVAANAQRLWSRPGRQAADASHSSGNRLWNRFSF
jgi:Cu2+-exporting ATPase